MRIQHQLISLLGLFFSFFLAAAGLFLFLPPFVPLCAQILTTLVTSHLLGLSYFGLTLFFLAVILLSLLNWLNRRRYLLVKMGSFSVDPSVIALYARECLQKIFPDERVECDVLVHRKKELEILAHLPFIVKQERESVFKMIEKELMAMLLKHCRYDKEFILHLSFAAEKKASV